VVIPHIVVIRQKTAAVVESWGRFERVLHAGTYVVLPWQTVAGRLSLRVQELQVNVETKTSDDVFVRLLIAVQYYVIPDRVREAFYELANPIQQIESYIFDEVRSAVPGMPLDEVFRNKDEIANAVKQNLEETMTQYGYGIVRALVNDIDPDPKVKDAMNEINAATRLRKAAEERGEAERILKVKQAQGDAESNVLHGKGIAGQRKAIIDGLRESVEEFEHAVPGATVEDVMQLILLTQYFDMLKEVGGNSRANTVMIPHTPGGLTEVIGQIRETIIASNAVNAAPDAAPRDGQKRRAVEAAPRPPRPSAPPAPSPNLPPNVSIQVPEMPPPMPDEVG
jgi:regulator of protease activity HflC (stomatin/prohibitin superfamily)